MKTLLIILSVFSLIGIGFTFGMWHKSIMDAHVINSYKEYYRATENLLDTLEYHDNWVDRFDPQDYYDAVSKLN